MTTCPNCSTPSTIGEFCPVCSQRNRHGRLQARELADDVLGQFLELKMPWLRTFVDLCTRPGLVALDYVVGKRARYVNPAKYFFVIIAIAYLVPVLLGDGRGGGAAPASVVLLVLVLMQVVTLRVLFWDAPRNATEIAVFALYLTAQSQLLQIVLLDLLMTVLERRETLFGTPTEAIMGVVAPTMLGVVYTYVVLAVGQFFAAPLWRAVIATVIAFGCAFFVVLALDSALGIGTLG